MPIFLLPIDTPRGLLVDETHGGTLTLDELPGFALDIVPGSATFPDGSKRGTVSVTLVHPDKVPMVPNFGQQPRFIITIQPPGTHFNPPAAMTMPNVDGLGPGQKTEMYSFDHDLGSFVSIGPATVSEDGTVVKSDPGVGVVKGGWHCGGNPSPIGSACSCAECKKCQESRCESDPTQNNNLCDNDTGICMDGSCIKPKVKFATDENDPKKPKLRNLNLGDDQIQKSVAIIWDEYEFHTVDLATFLTDDSDKDNIEWWRVSPPGSIVSRFPLTSSVFDYGLEPNENNSESFTIEARHKNFFEVFDRLLLVIVPRSTWNRFHRCAGDTGPRSDPCYLGDSNFVPWCPKETAPMEACKEPKDSAARKGCWLDELPAVYSHINIVNGAPEDPGSPNCCPSWNEPTNLRSNSHPGAWFEMRARPTPGGHGHQATYDENGQLIRSGLAAGSADMSHISNLLVTDPNTHFHCDVEPFVWAAQLDANPAVLRKDDDPTCLPVIPACYDLTEPLLHRGENLEKYLKDRPTPTIFNDKPELAPGACEECEASEGCHLGAVCRSRCESTTECGPGEICDEAKLCVPIVFQ